MKDNQRPHDENTSEDTEMEDTENHPTQTNDTGPAGGQQFDEAASGSFTPAAGTAVPPPVDLPGPDATTAGFTGASPAASTTTDAAPSSPVGGPPHVPSPLDSDQLAETARSGTQMAEDPLAGQQPADDPPGSDPLTLDRRNASRPHGE